MRDWSTNYADALRALTENYQRDIGIHHLLEILNPLYDCYARVLGLHLGVMNYHKEFEAKNTTVEDVIEEVVVQLRNDAKQAYRESQQQIDELMADLKKQQAH